MLIHPMAPCPAPVLDPETGYAIDYLQLKDYGWEDLDWECRLCDKQASAGHLAGREHLRQLGWWKQDKDYYKKPRQCKYLEEERQCCDKARVASAAARLAAPSVVSAPSPGPTAVPCATSTQSDSGASCRSDSTSSPTVVPSPGATAAPLAASTQIPAHVIMEGLQLLRHNTEQIHELVQQVNVLTQGNSQQIARLEELLLSALGGSVTLQ